MAIGHSKKLNKQAQSLNCLLLRIAVHKSMGLPGPSCREWGWGKHSFPLYRPFTHKGAQRSNSAKTENGQVFCRKPQTGNQPSMRLSEETCEFWLTSSLTLHCNKWIQSALCSHLDTLFSEWWWQVCLGKEISKYQDKTDQQAMERGPQIGHLFENPAV